MSSIIKPEQVSHLWRKPISFAHRLPTSSTQGERSIHGHSGSISVRYVSLEASLLSTEHADSFESYMEAELSTMLDYSLILSIDDGLLPSQIDKAVMGENGWRVMLPTIELAVAGMQGFYSSSRVARNPFIGGISINILAGEPTCWNIARVAYEMLFKIAAAYSVSITSIEFVEDANRRAQYAPERLQPVQLLTPAAAPAFVAPEEPTVEPQPSLSQPTG
jgi:6-pyruvoyl-tetrahydropterin synthase